MSHRNHYTPADCELNTLKPPLQEYLCRASCASPRTSSFSPRKSQFMHHCKSIPATCLNHSFSLKYWFALNADLQSFRFLNRCCTNCPVYNVRVDNHQWAYSLGCNGVRVAIRKGVRVSIKLRLRRRCHWGRQRLCAAE